MADTLILMYHRVAKPDTDPWALAVSPDSFAAQVEVVSSAYDVVPLADVPDQTARARPCVVFTFDDGYVDNLAAAQFLAARGLAATYFLTAGQLGSPYEFWWDELARIFLGSGNLPQTLELKVAGVALSLQAGTQEEAVGGDWRADQEPRTTREQAYLRVYGFLRELDHASRARWLEAIAAWAGVEREARPSIRSLTLDEVAELSTLDGAEIGAHTLTHPVLSSLPAEWQRHEILGSRRLLEEASGRPVLSFAYPHGAAKDYTPETVAIVRQAGLRRACAAVGGPVRQPVCPLDLPRSMVENWDAAEFERRIAALFADAQDA